MSKLTSVFFRSFNFCSQEKALHSSLAWGVWTFKPARAWKGFAVLFKGTHQKYQELYELLGHDLWLFKERKTKWDRIKLKKKIKKSNKSLPCLLCTWKLCLFLQSYFKSSNFWRFPQLQQNWHSPFCSLWKPCGPSHIFSEVLWSLFVLQSIFPCGAPTFPPHTQHLKLFVPSLEQRSEPLFNKDMPDTAKAGNLFPFFLRISVFSPHALQAFPHRCPGSFYLIKMHMQQREISKVRRSYMVWNVILKWFFLPVDYRGRHR